MIIAVFIPHGGCPERCHFCDQKTSGGTPVSAKHVTDTIDAHLASQSAELSSAKTPKPELAFYGGTFTAMPRDRQLAYLNAAKPYFEKGLIGSLRIATRSDALDEQWLITLRDEYFLKTVELGAQSFSSSVLQSLGRSHSVQSIDEGVKLLKRLGLTSSLHMMIGCPGEPHDEDQRTLSGIEKLRPDYVRIHPLLVIEGTELERRFKLDKAFVPLGLDVAIERAAWLVERIEALGVKVIRLGLQPNDLLDLKVVAGPYHPAFGDLVRGRMARNQIARRLDELKPTSKGQVLKLLVSRSLVGSLKSRAGGNLEWLQARYAASEVVIEETLEPHTLSAQFLSPKQTLAPDPVTC